MRTVPLSPTLVYPKQTNTSLLSWKPPVLVSPTEYVVPAGTTFTKIVGGPEEDIKVVMPGTTRGRRINIEGGRNVVLIGGSFFITNSSEEACINISGISGEIFIEGVDMNGNGLEIDLIDAGGDGSSWTKFPTVTIQNCRGVGNIGDFSLHHSDAYQPQRSVGWLRMDKCTFVVNYQGLFIPAQKPIGECDLRRINMSYDAVHKGYLIWLLSGGPGTGPFGLPNYNPYRTRLREIYLDPGTSGRKPEHDIAWPIAGQVDNEGKDIGLYTTDEWKTGRWPEQTLIQGSVNFGPPPGGDFVKANTVGIGYTSPGYINS